MPMPNKVADILVLKKEIRTKLDNILDAAKQKGEEITGDAATQFDTLTAEYRSLEKHEERIKEKDDIDRNAAPINPNLENRGEANDQ